MITFLDENDVEYGALATIKATNAVNGERSLTGTIASGDYVLSNIERGWRLRFDDEYYVVTYAKPIDEGRDVQVEFDAVHQFFWDFDKSSVYDQLSDGSHTFVAYLDFIFKNSGYSYTVDSALNVHAFEKQSFGFKKRLTLFNDIITSTGVEFQVNGKVVRILEKVGTDLSTVVRKNFNMNELTIEKNIGDFVTYQKGFGAYFDEEDHSKGRLEVEYTSPLASVYGKLEAEPFVDERYSQSSSLLAVLKENVDNSYTISVALDMEDLTRAGYKYKQPIAGDYIMAINETLDFQEKIRIVSFTSEYDVDGQLIKHAVTCNDIGSVKKLSAGYNLTKKQASSASVTANNAYSVANKALISADGKNTNYYGDTFPVDNPKGTLKKGDLLFLTVGDTVKQYYWNGADWVINPVLDDVEAFKEQIAEELKDVPDREEFENKIAEELATSKAEIETQIESAKTQAESNAKEYADTINGETAKVAELANAAAGEIKADLVNVKNNLTATSLVANNAQAAVDAAKQELTEVANELSTAKQDLTNSVAEVNTKVNSTKAELTQAKQDLTEVANELSTAKQDLTNSVAEVNTKVNSTKAELTQAKQDLISHAQQLQTQADAQTELTKRVTSVEKTADGTKTTVNELTKTVAQNGKDITSVTARTKTVEDDLAGTKTTLSQVKTTADSASQKTATLESGLDGLNAKFNNLKIGGRNLLSKTNQGKTNWEWAISSGWVTAENYDVDGVNAVKMTRTADVSASWSFIQYRGLIRKLIEPDTKYTLSFDVKPSVDVTFSAALKRGDGGAPLTNAANMNNALANKWTKVSCVLTSNTTLPDDLSQVVYLQGMPIANGNWLIIKNIKLEKGNVATDYSPSEVDIEQKVAEYKQNADQNYASLQTTVQNLDGTVKQNKSEFDQTASQIKSSISAVEGKIPTNIGTVNLIKQSTAQVGLRLAIGAEPLQDSKHELTDWIKIEPSTVYTLTTYEDVNEGSMWYSLAWYSTNNADYSGKISRPTGAALAADLKGGRQYKSPANAAYAKVSYPINYPKVKLERGNIATDYNSNPDDYDNAITQVKSEIKQTADGMTLLATKTELNSAKNDLQSGITTATNKANAAQSTANSNAQTISTHTTQISALNTGLQAKVSQSDFNTLSGRVTTAENTITAKANELSSKITSVEGKIPTNIGTVNLIVKSTAQKGLRLGMSEVLINDDKHTLTDWIKIEPSTVYTLTTYEDVNEANVYYSLAWYSTNNSDYSGWISRPTGAALAADLKGGRQYKSPANAAYAKVSYPINYPKVKLERGNIATDYNSNPDDYDNAITQVKSEIKQTADGMTLLATKTEVNSAKAELQSGITTATNKANNAQSTANSNAQTISAHTTQISALNTGLQAKVSQSDFNTLSGRVTTAENNITAKANELTSKITKVEGKIPTSVGGTNLLLYSADPWKAPQTGYYQSYGAAKTSETYNGAVVYKTSVIWNRLGINLDKHLVERGLLKVGDVLTYSVLAKTDQKTPIQSRLFIRYANQSGAENPTGKMELINLTNEWQKVSVTFTVTEKMLSEENRVNYLGWEQTTNSESGKFVYYTCNKIERGNVATDYSPAPEDTATQISSLSSQIQQTADGMTLLATKTELNSAKNELQSGITTATNKANSAQSTANNAQNTANSAQNKANSNAQTISTHTTQISALNTGLQAKVSQTDFNTLSGRVTTAENNITAKANELSSKITSVEGKIPTSSGGRNLAQGTSKDWSKPFTGFSGVQNTGVRLYKVITDGLVVGDTIKTRIVLKYTDVRSASGQTAVIWLQGAGNVTAWNSGAYPSGGGGRRSLSGSGEIVFELTDKIIADHLKNSYWSLSFRTDWIASGSLQWRLAKAERGMFFTDWSPAPEDTISQINSVSSELKQTKDGITLLATKTELNTAKSDLQSGINTATNKANAAQNTANSAQSTANSAQNTANSAQNTANSAQNKANSNAQTISTHTTQISALNTGLQAKVSQTDFNTLSGRVTTAENNITAKANELSSKISSVEGKIPTNIGTVNLIVKSTAQKGYRLGSDAGAFQDSNHMLTDWIKVEPNTTYTLTTYENVNENNNYYSLGWYSTNNNDYSGKISRPTGAATAADLKGGKQYRAPANAKYAKVSYPTKYAKVKLERGNIATDYNPNPDDYDAALTKAQSEIKQTTDAIKASVSSLDKSTVKSSSLTINADGIVMKAGKSTTDVANAIGSYFAVNQNAINLFSDKINVKGNMIVNGAITSDKIASKSINTAHLNGKIITADVISSNAVTTGAIKAGAVTTDKMSANSINGDRIAAGTLDAAKIKAGSITASQIASGTITSNQIKAGGISSANIAAGAITGDKIAAGAIDANKIAANAITANMIRGGQLRSTNEATVFDLNAGTLTFNNNYGYIQRVASDKVFEITTWLHSADASSPEYLTSAFKIRKSDYSRLVGAEFTLNNTLDNKPTASAIINADALTLTDSQSRTVLSIFSKGNFGNINMQGWGDIPVAQLHNCGLVVKDIGIGGHFKSLLNIVEELCKKNNIPWV